jgi:hypothetical protein
MLYITANIYHLLFSQIPDLEANRGRLSSFLFLILSAF